MNWTPQFYVLSDCFSAWSGIAKFLLKVNLTNINSLPLDHNLPNKILRIFF